MLKKKILLAALLPGLFFGSLLVLTGNASAAQRTYLYFCSKGQFIVREPQSPYVTCWTDTDNNGNIDDNDEYTSPGRQIGGTATSGQSIAEVSCQDGTPSENNNRFRCSNGAVPSVLIRTPSANEAPTDEGSTFSTGDEQPTGDTCGEGNAQTHISINIGCKGKGNGIIDALFAIIRFLSNGVGIIVVLSLVIAGIQYVFSAGDPGATSKAMERARNSAIALLIFIFAYAILNWLIPAGIFQ